MIAIEYRKSIARYLFQRVAGRRRPTLHTRALSLVSLCERPPPALPSAEWVRVRPVLSGICGSDLAALAARSTPYLSPLTSTPFVLGHEVVGTVGDVGPNARGVSRGDRVVLQPALGCRVRGLDPPCDACAGGRLALCSRLTRGAISAGVQTGYCRDTGGGWSEGFVAHPSQLYRVPDVLNDASAVLIEPLACTIHAVLRATAHASAQGSATILVIGCGTIGLLTLAALRTLDTALSGARIVTVARHAHQRELAQALGADEVVMHDTDIVRRYEQLTERLHAQRFRPEIGKPTVVGGADITFDCVASSESIDDSWRLTAEGGTVVLVGMPAVPSGIDWTSMWFKELTVLAAYAYGREVYDGRTQTTFELALETLPRIADRLGPLVGSPYALPDYRAAIDAALRTGASRSIKTVFRVE